MSKYMACGALLLGYACSFFYKTESDVRRETLVAEFQKDGDIKIGHISEYPTWVFLEFLSTPTFKSIKDMAENNSSWIRKSEMVLHEMSRRHPTHTTKEMLIKAVKKNFANFMLISDFGYIYTLPMTTYNVMLLNKKFKSADFTKEKLEYLINDASRKKYEKDLKPAIKGSDAPVEFDPVDSDIAILFCDEPNLGTCLDYYVEENPENVSMWARELWDEGKIDKFNSSFWQYCNPNFSGIEDFDLLVKLIYEYEKTHPEATPPSLAHYIAMAVGQTVRRWLESLPQETRAKIGCGELTDFNNLAYGKVNKLEDKIIKKETRKQAVKELRSLYVDLLQKAGE